MNENNVYGINRLSQGAEQGRIRGGAILCKATELIRKSERTNPEDQAADLSSQEGQEERLLKYAQENRLMMSYKDTDRIGAYLDNGAEQYVYLREGDSYVTKFNCLKFHETPLEYFDRLAVHNYLFPEASYTVVGFSDLYPEAYGFTVVVTQPYVYAQRGAATEEVYEEFTKMGFTHKNGNTYKLKEYTIEDLHAGNVLLTPNGNLAVIDPVIYINTFD